MKKTLLASTLILMLLCLSNMASAKNPIELVSKSAPSKYDSVQVTIDLGILSCVSLACEYYTVYIEGKDGSVQYLVKNKHYTGWGTFTLPWTAVTVSNPDRICVYWHFSGTCTPTLPDKTCCVPYTGSGTYDIVCNPCSN
jgi:hypothetical protein